MSHYLKSLRLSSSLYDGPCLPRVQESLNKSVWLCGKNTSKLEWCVNRHVALFSGKFVMPNSYLFSLLLSLDPSCELQHLNILRELITLW